MLFRWWRNRRRRQLEQQQFPPDWLLLVHRCCRHFAMLTPTEQSRLLRDTRWFLDEKSIEARVGMALTEEMKVTVAVHASLLGLGFVSPPFDRLRSIIFQPEHYTGMSIRPAQVEGGLPGLQIHSEVEMIGQASRNEPILLSWADVRQQCIESPNGRNVILHEFAHLLDMVDAVVDGVPPLDSEQEYRTWMDVTRIEYRRLINQVRLGRQTLLDQYATTNEGEFFAVATETFFEQPLEMRLLHPNLYGVLRAFYKQDPATRWQNYLK